MRYVLEIYMPGSARDVLASFEADAPFGAIARGDLLSTMGLEPSASPGDALEVVNLEHMIWQIGTDTPTHKLCVYTKRAEGNQELRRTRA